MKTFKIAPSIRNISTAIQTITYRQTQQE